MRENSSEQNDSLFQFEPSSLNKDFISIEDDTINMKTIKNNKMIDIAFAKDPKKVIIEYYKNEL